MYTIIREQSTIIGKDSQSLERIEREKDYINYLETHIANVKKAYETYFLPLLEPSSKIYDIDFNLDLYSRDDLMNAIKAIKDDVYKHDNSKWTDAEFEPYRMHWNPTEEEKIKGKEYWDDVDDKYNQAWVHHYKNNDHHPKHWYDFENGVARDMSLGAIIHMLCDWISFNVTLPYKTRDWWLRDASEERKYISPKTVSIVDDLLFRVLFPELEKDDNKIVKSDSLNTDTYNK